MIRFLLDTNIISNTVKPQPSAFLLSWLAARSDDELFTSSLVIAELYRGILDSPVGRRRDQLERWFAGPEGPPALFKDRILAFDEKAALIWARLMADGKSKGRPRSEVDTIIAATALANTCIVVTDNERDFADVDLVNPLRQVLDR